MTCAQEKTPPFNQSSDNPDAKSMDGVDIQLPTFNGNGEKYPEQHWFIYEVVWMVHLVQNVELNKAQMIATLRARALDWFMKFYVVPLGTP